MKNTQNAMKTTSKHEKRQIRQTNLRTYKRTMKNVENEAANRTKVDGNMHALEKTIEGGTQIITFAGNIGKTDAKT